ncbi:protein mahjong isoform X1 [Episyrphus balteatus]|uniref:protein mahjong isoform X1 n=3 Tax=Episyrphus balteatus TaxID=286459 RepID=UPI00248600F6|nr:protein mahjong isoform X1 [Episyrphus balteatus]
MRKDLDPFDERHPYRTDPKCQFGFLLKQLFRKDHFMNKLVNDYLRDNYFTRQNIKKKSLELNIISCRLILVIMPGLETSAVFQVEYDNLINRIYSWAEESVEPLQSYATGLLAAAMEVTDIAVTFRELNTRLVPKMIKRLHAFQSSNQISENVQMSSLHNSIPEQEENLVRILPTWMADSAPASPAPIDEDSAAFKNQNGTPDSFPSTSNMSMLHETSRDAAGSQKFLKRMYIPIHPHTADTSQMLILRYLTSMGEYQEFLGQVFENKTMQLICGYIKNLDKRDTCLAFEALKYLASLLCHKKFALEFISHGGLQLLLKVPRPSIASTGVSITLYYLAYCEDAMERICTMPQAIITELVKYALWLLGRSYDSGKCHATMFFGLSFQFKVILDEFDAQDGLRKLYNVISVLKIVNPPANDEEESVSSLNEDLECASRQFVRHVFVALKRYMESHLFYKYNLFMRQQCPTSTEFSTSATKANKVTLEQISEQVRTLQENTSVRGHWAPVDQLLKLGGIQLILKVIAMSYEWNNAGRAETVRSALDVLSICCVVPKVFLAFCETLELPDNPSSSGIHAILGAAVGEITNDSDVQKSALAVLCHCVCSPITRTQPASLIKCYVNPKKKNNKISEELVDKVWESVCSNNGIIILLQLMQIKVPLTDADCIRGMACRALAGLARSERVRQIVGKLPLFANGQIQHLMRDPILQEKRTEHVIFQKYALELLERVSGKEKPINNQLDPSLANIHKANVVAQTKIQYNEQQLFQLIYDHLESKGLSASAQMLQKEAGLKTPTTLMKSFHQSPFDYKVLPTNITARNRLRSRMQDVNTAMNGVAGAEVANDTNLNGSIVESNTPIKLVKKSNQTAVNTSGPSCSNNASSSSTSARSLQKQISSVPETTTTDEPVAPTITIATIVTEYLTNQHALCNNPMTTCPQFDLFTPHKCPDPQPNKAFGPNLNLTSRWFRSQAGFNTTRLDRRYVHSNFNSWRTIRANDYNDIQFTCCNILPTNNLIIVGTQQGEAKAFTLNEGTELFSSSCHSYLIDSIQSNRKGNLVLTSCSWRSHLWNIERNDFVSSLQFHDEFYCEFSNVNQDKILGTQTYSAIVYDLTTGNKISTFTPTIANQYTKNRATFCPTDELILSDGVLWDVRSGREIHKFDKLNQTLSGTFHPNGLEIISNTEVWDLRTFHLLQTVPVLDQCLIKFSPMNVLYGISLDIDNRVDFDDTTNYDTSFKVLDSYDYSSITTVDVKKHIYDLSVNCNGSIIALVENQPAYDSKQETFVKLYAVGMKKNEQQEEEEDEEPESDEGSDSESARVFEIPDLRGDDGDDDQWIDVDSSSSDDEQNNGDSDDVGNAENGDDSSSESSTDMFEVELNF